MLACNSPMLSWREGSGKVSPNAVDPRCISVHAVVVELAAVFIPPLSVLQHL